MTDIDAELRALREQMEQMRLRQRRAVALLTSAAVAGVLAAILLGGRPALSDPAAPAPCGHTSQLYCFDAGTPAKASQVNSNFETAFQVLDTKLDKTGGTLTGDLTVPNLTLTGAVSLGEYTATNSGGGGGSTAVCSGSDFVIGGQAQCTAGSLIAAGTTTYFGAWAYYGTCSGGATVNVTAYCLRKARQ